MKRLIPILLALCLFAAPHSSWALTAIVDTNNPPSSYVDQQGKVNGYDAAVLRMMQYEYGWSIDVRALPANQAINELMTGQADIVAGVTRTSDRESPVSYSVPYLSDNVVMFVRKDIFHMITPAALKGHRVAILRNSTIIDYLHRNYPDLKVYPYDEMSDALQSLNDGYVDAVIGSYFSGAYWAHKLNLEDKVKVTGRPILQLQYTLAVPKHNENLLKQLNDTLVTAQKTGVLKRLQDQYFGEDYFSTQGRISRQELLDFLRYGTLVVCSLIIVVILFLRYQRRQIAKATKDLVELNQELTSAYETIIRALLNAVEQRESNTAKHSLQVNRIAMDIGRKMGLSEQLLVHLNWGTLLHDIGKLAIADSILLKPGPLTDEEYKVIKKHPLIGYEIVKDAEYLQEASKVVLYHQEKYDGKGYPSGIRGNDIPLLARICAVADAFEAMIADRPYRTGMDYQDAINEIVRNRGTQFDPAVVDAFLAINPGQYVDARTRTFPSKHLAGGGSKS